MYVCMYIQAIQGADADESSDDDDGWSDDDY
jgi:hypothetical protein